MQQPVGIAGERFERMAEGMAEIEQRAGAALLPLVGLDDGRLGAARWFRPRAGAPRLTPEKISPPILFEPGEERRIAEQPVFHHFGIARPELARAQGRQTPKCRPAPGSADGRCRSGSCLAACRCRSCRRPTKSTWASSEVGICTTRTPRRRMLAAKPARSPTTPPPRAMTQSPRSTPSSSRLSQSGGEHGKALARLAGRHNGLAEIEPVRSRLALSGPR